MRSGLGFPKEISVRVHRDVAGEIRLGYLVTSDGFSFPHVDSKTFSRPIVRWVALGSFQTSIPVFAFWGYFFSTQWSPIHVQFFPKTYLADLSVVSLGGLFLYDLPLLELFGLGERDAVDTLEAFCVGLAFPVCGRVLE